MKLCQLVLTVLFTLSVGLLGCSARLRHLPAGTPGNAEQQAQAWLARMDAAAWTPAAAENVLPCIALDGNFQLQQDGTLYYSLGSLPWFGGTFEKPEFVVYRNAVWTYAAMVADVVERHHVPVALADRLAHAMLDHNGCFRNEQGALLRDMRLTRFLSDPSIKTGWILAGHGGGDGDDYQVGSMPLILVVGCIVDAGYTRPDLLMIASCNPHGTTPLRDRLAELNCRPRRLGWAPNGFSATNREFISGRRWLLMTPAHLTRPREVQFGHHYGFSVFGFDITKREWVLYRGTIDPVVPVALTRAATKVAGVAVGLLAHSLSVGQQVWRVDLTAPLRDNQTPHAWQQD